MNTEQQLRKALLEFDKSRGQTGVDYIDGKITRLQADSEFEDDIAKIIRLVKALLVQEQIDELQSLPQVKFDEPHKHKSQKYRDFGKFLTIIYLPKRIATLQATLEGASHD